MVQGVSVRGREHQRSQLPNQDYFSHRTVNKNLIVCVSDGASMAINAAEGSRLACELALTVLVEAVQEKGKISDLELLMNTVVSETRTKLVAHVAPHDLRDYSATLLVALVTPTDIALLQLGDGGLFGCYEGNWQRLIAVKPQPKNRPYFITEILKSEDYQYFQQPRASLDTIVMVTDGLEEVLYNESVNEIATGFLNKVTAFLARTDLEEAVKIKQLSADMENKLNKVVDDKTMVVISDL